MMHSANTPSPRGRTGELTPTIAPCPQGCGGTVATTDEICASCRRALNVTEIPEPGTCWSWFGPTDHRMRCRKPLGHGGTHCEHADRCGASEGVVGWYCDLPPDHSGQHAWEGQGDATAEDSASEQTGCSFPDCGCLGTQIFKQPCPMMPAAAPAPLGSAPAGEDASTPNSAAASGKLGAGEPDPLGLHVEACVRILREAAETERGHAYSAYDDAVDRLTVLADALPSLVADRQRLYQLLTAYALTVTLLRDGKVRDYGIAGLADIDALFSTPVPEAPTDG